VLLFQLGREGVAVGSIAGDAVGAVGSILPCLEPNTATFTAVANRSN